MHRIVLAGHTDGKRTNVTLQPERGIPGARCEERSNTPPGPPLGIWGIREASAWPGLSLEQRPTVGRDASSPWLALRSPGPLSSRRPPLTPALGCPSPPPPVLRPRPPPQAGPDRYRRRPPWPGSLKLLQQQRRGACRLSLPGVESALVRTDGPPHGPTTLALSAAMTAAIARPTRPSPSRKPASTPTRLRRREKGSRAPHGLHALATNAHAHKYGLPVAAGVIFSTPPPRLENTCEKEQALPLGRLFFGADW